MVREMTSLNSLYCNLLWYCRCFFIYMLFILFYCLCEGKCHPSLNLNLYFWMQQCQQILSQVLLTSLLLDTAACRKPFKWPISEAYKTCVCVWGVSLQLFEGRIGWGSCKLPNNLPAQHHTVLNITMSPVYLDHRAAFDGDPSPGWVTSWNSALLLHYKSCSTDLSHKQ